MASFEDLVNDPKELRRIIDNYVFAKGIPKDFNGFAQQFRDAFNSTKGENTNLTTDKIISFFETPYVKQQMKKELTEDEFEYAYGDGVKVDYESKTSKRGFVRIETPKITQKQKSGKTYSRGKPRKFTKVQEKYIAVRKKKGVKMKDLVQQYNTDFPEQPRTYSSIKTKSRRTK